MATAAELLAAACTSGISCLNELDLLRIIAQGASTGGGGGGGGGGTLSTDGTFAANSDLLYPSQKAAKTYVDTSVAAALVTASGLYVLKSGDTMTGALLLPNGAVGAPSLGHVADANTGLWFPAADEISLATSGADRLHILSTGNVGIGQISPLAKLHVTPAASGTDYFRIDHSDGTPRLQVGVYPGNALFTGLWAGNVTPTANNEALISDGATVYLNAQPSGNIYFSIDTGAIWRISGSAGHFLAGTDNTYDIGASGATRPRNVYVAGSVVAANIIGTVLVAAPRVYVGGANTATLYSPSDGILALYNSAETDFNRLQLGGTTASFPSIKRNGAGIDFRLADDSAYASITAKDITQATAALFSVTSGTNQRAGDATLVGGTVTVANATVTANTKVFAQRKTAGGTIGMSLTYTVSAATSFTITSDNILDTSTYSYLLIEVP